ncbi:hypothetical protein [Inmirania thermothiophila]|uniref:Uncharacterized protein n=1 Tax=Inmirania thermothiophila TaxID=1750597 RepID=A0A3N1Y2H6_9GAMM|nr:hypothetical protein [Inmirania thermothiophila]ROR32741.1 hypothetical protein EDC57_1952 [Inmirania thermothiophila]
MPIRVLLALAALALALPAGAEPRVIVLTQTGCQFLEPEGTDHGFVTRSADDCRAINARTGAERVAKAKPLVLKPGRYVFRVVNRDVPYELGFWLRGRGIGRLTLPSVSGGGIAPGTSRDYEVDLRPGEYLYSCPLNPTPDYPLIVRE